MPKTIHLVEDDASTLELIRFALQSAGFAVTCFENGEDFLFQAKKQIPGLVLLDIMLPGMSGFEIIKAIRSSERLKNIPVIFVTAKDTEMDKAQGLDLGADDYITKPFGTLELVARVKARFRRSGNILIDSKLHYKDINIDVQSHEVYRGKQKVDLTLKEYQLLLCLLENKGRVLTREELIRKLGRDSRDGKSRTIDMHVKSLRHKLGDSFHDQTYISTIRSVGYKLENEWL
jgi:two-component system alkaline phosphatase synthesis response regulator PhoP